MVGAVQDGDTASEVGEQETEVLHEGSSRGDGAQVEGAIGVADQLAGAGEGLRIDRRGASGEHLLSRADALLKDGLGRRRSVIVHPPKALNR